MKNFQAIFLSLLIIAMPLLGTTENGLISKSEISGKAIAHAVFNGNLSKYAAMIISLYKTGFFSKKNIKTIRI